MKQAETVTPGASRHLGPPARPTGQAPTPVGALAVLASAACYKVFDVPCVCSSSSAPPRQRPRNERPGAATGWRVVPSAA